MDNAPPTIDVATLCTPDMLLRLDQACREWGVFQLVLAALAANLGEVEAILAAGFQPAHTSFVPLNYYPVSAANQREELASVAPHLAIHSQTDAGAVTLSLRDEVAGLQILKDDQWYTVAAKEGALLVNIGDIVQSLSVS